VYGAFWRNQLGYDTDADAFRAVRRIADADESGNVHGRKLLIR
jgi:hypothetical protein